MPLAKVSTGITLYYESHGRGEPIVFIPGTGFAGNVWMESQVQELARSHQVIVHDPRGCGRSTHAKGVYTIDLMGNDVVALLEHLCATSACDWTLDGGTHRPIHRAKFSRQDQKPDYCRRRLGASR